MNTDDKIRAILRMEADTVDPSPAGWDAIQAGIAARRTRAWWTRGSALVGAAAMTIGVLTYVAIDRSERAIDAPPSTQGPGETESPTASPTPLPTTGPNEPIGAIWPLTTTHEVARWHADHETYPSLATASSSALAFARNYIGATDATVFPLEGSFGENEFEVRRDTTVVSVVTVKGFGPDGTGPFVVIRAKSDGMQIDSPAAGGAVSGEVTARGSYEAVDPAIDVTLRADTDGSAPVDLGKKRAVTGPSGWSAVIPFTTTAKTGSLLVTNASLKDGGVGSAAAIPLVFGAEPASFGPATMVAARDGRIALIATATGELIRWLTSEEPGGGASDPELSPDGKSVVYAQGAGTCAAEIRSVPVTGGAPTTLVPASEGALSNPSSNGATVAYRRVTCDAEGHKEQAIVVRAGTTIVDDLEGSWLGGPVVGQRFVAYVGVEGESRVLHTIDSVGELADNPVNAPAGCTWVAPAWGPPADDGRDQLFVVASCSPRDEVVETWLYRFDQDARNMTRLERFDLNGVQTADFAGDVLVLGVRDVRDPDSSVAYALDTGTFSLRRIPGEAQRPSWTDESS